MFADPLLTMYSRRNLYAIEVYLHKPVLWEFNHAIQTVRVQAAA
jgi:hypothetical protein